MSAGAPPLQATFRDPAGRLQFAGERVLRWVKPEYAADALRFLRSEVAANWVASGRMVETVILSSPDGEPLELEHPRIFFASYPWEWTPGEWIAAGELTLDLAEDLLPSGRTLKDATPLNVLFRGPKPVFVDVLSTELRDAGNPIWLAYGQFVRTFLLPLAAYRFLGWPLSASMMRRDGYEPRDLYPHLSSLQRWQAPFRSLVTLPYLFEKKSGSGASAAPTLRQSPEIATDVLRRTLRGLRKTLRSLAPPARASKWSGYPETAAHYAAEDRAGKVDFVTRAMGRIAPGAVLDIGANTGEYSRVAANAGARVVAWDTDVEASERNRREALSAGLDILPLIADPARPTPAAGWRNAESFSLLERSAGRFDCVLMLGVIHHLLLADQIPLPAIAALVADLTTRWAVVEWVPVTDPRFVDLCRGRDALYGHLDEPLFQAAFAEHFTLTTREKLSNGRVLCLFERHTTHG